MKKLILGIGIPASGKSTFLEALAIKYGYKYICIDNVREEFNISRDNPIAATDNNITFALWDEIRIRTKLFLLMGHSVIVDATFAKKELRTEFVLIGLENQAEKIVGVFMDTSQNIAWERNLFRVNKVPREVFNERVEALKTNPPSLTDGFDSIFFMNENGLFQIKTKQNTKNLLQII